MRNKIYSERHRRLHTFFKNVIKNSFLDEFVNGHATRNAAETDALTGLYNQFGINSYLKELHPQAGMDYAIVLLSVDNYDDIKKEFGPKAADKALVSIASILSTHLRETDLVGRYGEQEFILILSNITLENANSISYRLVNLIQEKAVKMKSHSVMLQTSCGVSVSEQDSFSSKILQQADQALFIAKSNRGGKQVCDQRAIVS